MKIAALIPLILKIIISVDFLKLIPNVEEHNVEFVELSLFLKRTADVMAPVLV